jgi:hypothetical protein
MIVIAMGFLEFCHSVTLWMNRSVSYKDLFLLNLDGVMYLLTFMSLSEPMPGIVQYIQ